MKTELLTCKDLQSILHIGRDTAYALMHSQTFPTMRINRRLYVSRSALDGWLSLYAGKTYLT